MANGYIGYSTFKPNFKPKGFEATGDWKGAAANFGGMNFSFYQGQLRDLNADSTMASPNGSVFRIGYQLGKEYSTGNNSFLSAGIKPYLQLSAAVAQIPNRLVNTQVSSAGLVFSPGIQLRFSHVYLAASYDAGLYMNTSWFGGNGKLNLGKGYVGGTTLTIGIENGFDLLVPKVFSFKGYNVKKKTYRKDNGVKFDMNRSEFYREIVYTTVTNYSRGERVLALVNPFWGVGPSYSFRSLGKRSAPTAMTGINAGVRFWYLMIDGFYEQGNMGIQDETNPNDILKTYPRLRDYDFSFQVPAKSYGGRIGLNLTKFFALQLNFKQDQSSKRQSMWGVPFTRVNAFYTMGKTEFTGTPNYTYENGQATLNDFQAKNGITQSVENNASFIPQTASFQGYGASLEIGAAFFTATWYTYNDAPIVDHMNYTVGANIPLGRIFHSVRTRLLL